MKRLTLSLALFLALASAAAAQESKGDTVTFELKTGILFVEGTINGKGPFTFIFDTGASVTVLRPQTAKQLGIEAKGSLMAPALVRVESIALGKAEVKNSQVAVMTAPQAEIPLAMQGIKYDGIIGYPYISRFVTTIDYQAKTIKLVPSDYEPVEQGVPETKASGEPYVGMSPRAIGADEANEIGIDGGVVVHKIAKGSPAGKGGLKEKDIIQEMNGKRIDTVDDYYAIVKKSKPGDSITFSVIRDKKDVEVKVVVGAKK